MSAYLQPVPDGIDFDRLAGFERHRGWLGEAMAALESPELVKPRGALLAGPPACGKYTCARATALHMGRPMLRFDARSAPADLASVLDALDPCVLWIEELEEAHRPLVRWMTARAKLPALVVAGSTRPWRIPPDLLRADGFDRIFHLDLPDAVQRARLWEAAIARYRGRASDYDPARLAQACGLFTPGEIMAAARRTFIAAGEGRSPAEREFVDQLAAIVPLAISLDEDIAALRHWARRHAQDVHEAPDLRV